MVYQVNDTYRISIIDGRDTSVLNTVYLKGHFVVLEEKFKLRILIFTTIIR